MKKHSMKVALNVSKLSIPSLINRGRFICDSILSNPETFQNPNPPISTVQAAIDDLEIAWADAADGGKTKTAIMRDREDALLKLLYDTAHYVEAVADGNEDTVHLAGMQIKKQPVFHIPDFGVEPTDDRGAVRLRVKPHSKSAYRWEYRKNHEVSWIVAKTTVQSTTNWGDLVVGETYWFRVFYVGAFGEIMPFNPVSIVVS